MISGHAHLGVRSILAIVLGVVDLYGPTGRLQQAVTVLSVPGQWLPPLSLWVSIGVGVTRLLPLVVVCILGLAMAYHVTVADPSPRAPRR